MPVTRIEQLTYGSEDLAVGVKFFEDFGLDVRSKGDWGTDFILPTGQVVAVRSAKDASLPPAVEPGSTVRVVTWGVDTQASLKALAENLSSDRDVKWDDKGGFHTTDINGLTIAFRVQEGKETELREPLRGPNQFLRPGRKPRIMRLAHAVWFCPPDKLQATMDFYTQRLGFKVSDVVKGIGAFMRAPLNPWHHNMFLLTVKPAFGLHHVSWDVHGIDDMVNLGQSMRQKGYTTVSALGRHVLGSSVHWYFKNPNGGMAEYTWDTDLVDDNYQTKYWDTFPGADQWLLTPEDVNVMDYSAMKKP